MDFLYFLFPVLIGSFFLYSIYSNYSVQLYLRQKKNQKEFASLLAKKVSGKLISQAYYGTSHKIINFREFNSYSRRVQLSFNKCYNVIVFETPDDYWEIFLNLVKDSSSYSEILNIRIFPKRFKIKYLANVDRSLSRLNIYSNNRHLNDDLESGEVKEVLRKLIHDKNDILYLFHNNLHLKVYRNKRNFDINHIISYMKWLNYVKRKIYNDDLKGY